jgi:hypothetical protein
LKRKQKVNIRMERRTFESAERLIAGYEKKKYRGKDS